ncbi:MAG TPA: tryptophan--tRNA ligase [Candidatus Paceibacterota bacterium]|nr:tryptophan--tRNA ligase [Candidatus Paceibacterota bacterium]
MAKKRLFTGLQPSGQLHIGNYFGALKPLAGLAGTDHYESVMLMVADYHALTTLKNPQELKENIFSIVKDYLAVLGDNSRKVIIFKQSDIPEHTELTWIFNCLITQSFLELGHAFKDKQAKGLESNFGLLDYPVLMAADILLYSDKNATTWVPVGIDQEQHLEYTREIAAKFNTTFGGEQTFSYQITAERFENVGKIPGTDGQKMSKSYKNTIPLFGTKEEIAKAVMSIVTDSSGGIPENVLAIHKLFRQFELASLEEFYESNKGNNKFLKEELIKDIEKEVSPMREKRASITDEEVKKVLADGAEKARTIASAKMTEVRKKVGVTI